MLYQLALDHFHLARPLFAAETRLAVTAALAGESTADLYVDDSAGPQAALLILWNHRIYLAGTPGNAAFSQDFASLLHDRYMPKGKEWQPFGFAIDFTSSLWEDSLASLFPDMDSLRAEHQYYSLHLRTSILPPSLPEGFVLRKVDEALLAQSSLGNYQSLVEEIHSESASVDDFLQHKFGYCVQYGQDLVGWCLSEYNHGNQCELGIETLEGFQRRGLAATTAQATMAYAQAKGMSKIGWHCWKANIPSSSLARKLGFEHVEDHPMWHYRSKRQA
jgi:RimJ/RimL family protein N-acetyltransferase